MTTTLTLTALPEVAAVLLTVTDAPAGELVILRTDSNGEHPVRLLPDQAPIGGSLTVRDYEPALTGTVTYTLDGQTLVGGVTTPITLTASTSLGLARAVVSVPVRPARRSDQGVVTAWTESRQSSAIVHTVPERKDPIILAGKLRLRTGTAVVRVPSYVEGAALRDLAEDGDVLLLRVPGYPGMDAYVRVDQADLDPAEVEGQAGDWAVTFPYREVAAPTAPLLGAADWTLADVAATVPTLRVLALTFPTLRSLAVGP